MTQDREVWGGWIERRNIEGWKTQKEFQVKMGKNAFAVLILVARPAAGKSEIIDYLKKTDLRRAGHASTWVN